MIEGPSLQKGTTKYLESIDSHFSLGQNMVNFKNAQVVSDRALMARDDPTFPNLKAYYNAINEFYECFIFVIPDERIKDFEKKAKQFNDMYFDVLDGIRPMSERTSMQMLFVLKNMRFILTSTMQKLFSYFYRMSKRQTRGLNNLDTLLDENIFK